MGIRILEKLLEGLLQNFGLIMQAVLKVVQSLAKFFNSHAKDFLSMGIQILTLLIQGLGKMLPELIAEALFLATQFLEKIKNQDWKQLGKDIISFFLLGIKGMYDLAVEGATELIDKIWTTITDINWGELGENILKGIVDGILNIGDKLKEFGGDFLEAMQNVFTISSPSKLMRDEVGKYLGLGIVEGLEQNLPDMQNLSDRLSSEFNPEFDFPDFPQISLIDENALQAFRLQSAKSANLVQSSPTSPVVNNYYQQTTNNTTTNNQKNSQQGNIIVPIYLEGEQIRTAVLSAVQIENLRSGGDFV
jgi:hypothetical protein